MFLDLAEKYGAPMSPPTPSRDLDDALSVSANSPEELTIQILGQIRDSLTVINRKQDAITSKVDDTAMRVVRLEERGQRLDRLETTVEKQGDRIDALLKDKDQRDGAAGIVTAIMKSPTLGWLVGAAVSAWAILTGKVHV